MVVEGYLKSSPLTTYRDELRKSSRLLLIQYHLVTDRACTSRTALVFFTRVLVHCYLILLWEDALLE